MEVNAKKKITEGCNPTLELKVFNMINILIADDHRLVRQGIQALLERSSEGNMKVVGEAANGEEALKLTKYLLPNVLLLDMAMPDMNGLRALTKLSSLNLPTKVLILSMYADETLVQEVLRNGAKGYLLKRTVSHQLLKAIQAVNRGEIYLCPSISEFITQSAPQTRWQKNRFSRLTTREREVLQLIAQGQSNYGMAKKLLITVKTVEKHRASLIAKLNVSAVAELTQLAIQHGLLSRLNSHA